MKLKFVLEQPSGTGVGHEQSRAAHSDTCYGKLTHKGHVYVYDNTVLHELNTQIHTEMI